MSCGGGLGADHCGGFLGNHVSWRIGVGRSDPWHDRGIDDAQTVDAVDPQLGVHDGARVRSHAAGANQMIDRSRHLAHGPKHFGVALMLGTRNDLAPPTLAKFGPPIKLAHQADALDDNLLVLLA